MKASNASRQKSNPQKTQLASHASQQCHFAARVSIRMCGVSRCRTSNCGVSRCRYPTHITPFYSSNTPASPLSQVYSATGLSWKTATSCGATYVMIDPCRTPISFLAITSRTAIFVPTGSPRTPPVCRNQVLGAVDDRATVQHLHYRYYT